MHAAEAAQEVPSAAAAEQRAPAASAEPEAAQAVAMEPADRPRPCAPGHQNPKLPKSV